MRALARIADTEVFAFGTSLTRLTAALGHDSAEVALAQANERVTDRFGGTRIATNLERLMRSHHASALRGAVVMIASDGWDSDPPEQLGAAMARLGRRAHRVVWANPRAGSAGFRPEVSSIAAALPYCDGLLAADTFAALDRVVSALLADDRDVALSSRGSRGSRAGSGRR